MEKRLRRLLALIITIFLAGSTVEIVSDAQEIEENDSETAEGAFIKITVTNSTLDCEEALRNMSWEFFCEGESRTDWIGRMNFPDYASDFYFTLIEGADNDEEEDVLIEDSAFSEDTAVKIEYTNGKEDVFNGIEVLNVNTTAKMTEEEWGSIQENIENAYNAFRLDCPEVFWLSDTPKLERICTVRDTSEGAQLYEYKVYFLLKNHNRSYDIRNEAYQSAEAVKEAIERREQSIQQVFDGVKRERPAEMAAYFNEKLDIVVNGIGLESNDRSCALKMLCDYSGIPCVLVSGLGGMLDGYVKIRGEWCMGSEVQTELKKSDADKAVKREAEENKKDTSETEETFMALSALRNMEAVEFAKTAQEGIMSSLKTNAYFERKKVEGNIEVYERIQELEELVSINSEPYYYSAWEEVVPLSEIDYSDLYIHVKDSGSPDEDRQYPADAELVGLLGVSADTRIVKEAQNTCDFIIVYSLRTEESGEDYGCYNMFSGSVIVKSRAIKEVGENS